MEIQTLEDQTIQQQQFPTQSTTSNPKPENKYVKFYHQNYLPEIVAAKEQSKKQRLDKRMLRSKILTIIEQNFFYKCPSHKLTEYENKLRK